MSPKLSSGVWHKDPTEPRCKQQDENIQLLYNCFLDSMLQNRPITLPTKVHMVKAMVSPAVIYGCESWTIKKAESWSIDAFELWCWRILQSPLDSKEIKPVNPKGNQPWLFIKRIDAEAPILWPPDAKSWFTGIGSGAGEDWGQEEKVTEDEMDGWHH